MSDNVKIPFSLLSETIEVLESIDATAFHPDFDMLYHAVLYELRRKKDCVALRQAYSNIVYAQSDDERHAARMRYLQQKRELHGQRP